ncbi:MAG TPA: ThuA domain-containing protein [Verrucomicrobiae bacterium]|jgi:trehalose utilization protein
MRIWFTLLAFALAPILSGKDIRVLVWDEQQPAQKKAYTNFLGNQIATYLRGLPELKVSSVAITDPEQGLTDDAINHADVLVWWGHARHAEVNDAKAKLIVERIKDGKLSLIALHSAHWSKPFVFAMEERTRTDALKQIPAGMKTEFVPAPKGAPKTNALLTPRLEMTNAPDGSKLARVVLPMCVFPAWRADGASSHVTTLLPAHPIARGIPARFDIAQTEMYSEPFHVPAPDLVIFREDWDKGEWFRSGCVWNVGAGKVFYFRPGHEVYAVFTEENPLKIIGNAVQWLGGGTN